MQILIKIFRGYSSHSRSLALKQTPIIKYFTRTAFLIEQNNCSRWIPDRYQCTWVLISRMRNGYNSLPIINMHGRIRCHISYRRWLKSRISIITALTVLVLTAEEIDYNWYQQPTNKQTNKPELCFWVFFCSGTFTEECFFDGGPSDNCTMSTGQTQIFSSILFNTDLEYFPQVCMLIILCYAINEIG